MKKEVLKGDEYTTVDLYETALLVTKKQKLSKFDTGVNPYQFVFSDKTKCEKISNSFWERKAQIKKEKGDRFIFVDFSSCLCAFLYI